MRLRSTFEKGGDAKYISHLDLQRTFERSLKRAAIDVSYSEGFNPKPRFSLASALMLGATGENEVMDCRLASDIAPERFVDRLNSVLPETIRFKRARQLAEGARDCAAVTAAARYRITFPGLAGRLLEAASRFINTPSVVIEKKAKGALRKTDVKPLVVALRMPSPEMIEVMIDISGATVKPTEFVQALFSNSGIKFDPLDASYHRIDIMAKVLDHYIPVFEVDV